MLGANLNASMVKFVADVSGSAMTQSNFVEGDYTPELGFVLASNPNKSIGSGFIPYISAYLLVSA